MQTNFPENVSWRLHPEISRGFSENERNPKYERQPIGLIKRLKAGLENLLISTYPKRRIGERIIRGHRKRTGQKGSVFIERCTYKE
jgi:hypothetical protein